MKYNGKTLFVMGDLAASGEVIQMGVKVNAVTEDGAWADVTVIGDVPARLFDTYFTAIAKAEIKGATKIGNSAFYKCALEEIVIPASIQSIGPSAFSANANLKRIGWNPVSVNVDGVNNSSNSVFNGCSGVTEFIFANDVQDIPKFLCANMTALAEIVIPATVKSIGEGAFSGCTALAGELVIPAGLTTLSADIFRNCAGLTRVVWKPTGTLTLLGIYNQTDAPFGGCSGVTEFIFADGVTIIPSVLCASMTALSEVTISASVESIGSNAFYGDTALTDVVIEAERVVTLSNKNAFTNTPIASGTGTVWVKDDWVDSYKSATNWATYANQIKPLSERGV